MDVTPSGSVELWLWLRPSSANRVRLREILTERLLKVSSFIPDPLMKNVLKRPVFDRSALQEYILFACQYEKGGLLDKPDK